VIPIENSLDLRPALYLRAETGKIPEAQRVIVAYENKIAMEETLERALERIFGEFRALAGAAVPWLLAARAAGQQPPAVGDLAARARGALRPAIKAQREGNWALYGERSAGSARLIGRCSERRAGAGA
jgi:hypothetical protein